MKNIYALRSFWGGLILMLITIGGYCLGDFFLYKLGGFFLILNSSAFIAILIMGNKALKQIKESKNETGRAYAIWGIVFAFILFFISLPLILGGPF